MAVQVLDIKQSANLIPYVTRNMNQGFTQVSPQGNWAAPLWRTEAMNKETGTYEWFQQTTELESRANFYTPVDMKTPHAEILDITMEYYAAGIAIPRLEAQLDAENKWIQKAQKIGVLAQNHTTDMALAAIRAGTSTTIYDGQNWFDNSHPRGGTTFDNLLGGDLSTTTIVTAKVAMGRFPDDLGNASNHQPDSILVAGEFEYTAKSIVNNTLSPTLTAHTENVLKGIVSTVWTDSRIPSSEDDDWYAFCTSSPFGDKPMLHVEFRPGTVPNPEITNNSQMWGKEGWNQFYEFAIRYNHNLVILDPRLAIKFVGA